MIAKPRHVPLAAVLLLLAALVVVRVSLAHSLNVHWDEFYFLSKIHSYERGELIGRLLTFHVHLLGWVRLVADDEVSQVLRIRDVMLALGVVGAVATFLIGRSLLQSTVAAAFAVFAGQSLSIVLNHGSSARFDPVVVASLLVASALIVRGGRRNVVAAGVITALGLLVSVKTALYGPTLVGLFMCRAVWGPDRRETIRQALLFALATTVAFAPLFVWHASSLAGATASAGIGAGAASPDAQTGLSAILAKVIVLDIGVQNEKALLATLRWDWGFWALLAIGVALALVLLWREREREARLRTAQLLCFALPLSALVFYRNSFPYFYVCVAPPAALVVGLVFARVERRLAQHALVGFVVMAVLAFPLVRAAVNWTRYNGDDQLAGQRQIVNAVHETFPEPVPYIDRCAMIASFKKVGPFMSTWTISEYKARGQPVMRALLREQRPQFLLQNIRSLEVGRRFTGGRRVHRLMREDFDALRKSFIPHWGPVWVAGQTIALGDASKPVDTPDKTGDAPGNTPGDKHVDIEVLIPGRYVVEAAALIVIDGQPFAPGAIVDLALGAHRISSSSAQTVTLRTATARPPLSIAPPRGPIFEGFQYRERPPKRARPPVADPDEADEADDV